MSFKYESCEKAAKVGDLEELKKMHENGYPLDKWVCALAAQYGNLECLRYAHSQGCEWYEYTTYNAAKKGHLDCLRYAFENGCQWDKLTPESAAKNGHLECFKYCFEMWTNPQLFWDNSYNLTKIIDQIDLDKIEWRKLFHIDLSKHPDLQSKVENKKKEIEELKSGSKEALQDTLPLDIIQYCIYPLF